MNAPTSPAPVVPAIPVPVPPFSLPPVSVVMPVRDEERHLAAAVRSVLDQDYPGRVEVVLAVGPSRDRTAVVARELAARDARVVVAPNPDGTIPAALNTAIKAARFDVVARVDGHALLAPGYLRTAVTELTDTGAADVGGIMAAEGISAFERAVAWAMTSPLGVGASRFHTGGRAGPADSVYLGVYRRAAIEQAGGYDERYLRAEDWELNHRIRLAGGLVWFQPALRVTYRPRGCVRALATQYFHYGRWRHVVARRHVGTINLRYLAPPAAFAAVAAGSLAGVAGVVAAAAGMPPAPRRLAAGLLLPAAYLTGVTAVAALAARDVPASVRLRLPVVLATMHMSWGAGFVTSPRGLVPPAAQER